MRVVRTRRAMKKFKTLNSFQDPSSQGMLNMEEPEVTSAPQTTRKVAQMKTRFAILMLSLALGTTGWSQVILQVHSTGPQTYTPPKTKVNPLSEINTPARPIVPMNPRIRVNSCQQYTESVNISVRSLTTNTVDCVVEWWFFVQPVNKRDKPEEHGSGNKQITLTPLGATNFRADSPPWERVQGVMETPMPGYYDYQSRWRQPYMERQSVVIGHKAGGYVVRVLVDNKVVGIEASTNALKEQFKTVAKPK